MKLNIKYQLISTAGEVTAVITVPVIKRVQANLARRIMEAGSSVEQVVFLDAEKNQTIPSLRMMGGELSVNGTAAAAYVVMEKRSRRSIIIRIATLNNPVTAMLNDNTVSVLFPSSLVKRRKENVVTLRGINYRIVPGLPKDRKVTVTQRALLAKLANTAPASGLIYYEGDTIAPLIYVKATRSYVWEQACGSGSIAFSLYSGISNIRQPSGDTIQISFQKNAITYKASAKIVANKSL